MIGRVIFAAGLVAFARIRLRRFVRIQQRVFFACLLAPREHRTAAVRRVVTIEGSLLICAQHGLLYEAFEPGRWE